MKKIISVIGARPQFIKHAPVQLALQQYFQAITVHTGQHYDENMSKLFFDELNMPKPEYLLDAGTLSSQGAQTGKMMADIESILLDERPDAVLVYGDTNSTLAATLSAVKLHIPIIHVEAGLRSFNREMPEEINRIVADEFSTLLFCPTANAIENLEKEGIRHEHIYQTGDVMADMIRIVRPGLKRKFEFPYYFATIHRPYNTDDPERLRAIILAMEGLDKKVIFSVHPRTRKKMAELGLDADKLNNILFEDPLGYQDSISYQFFSDCVLTDSGGVQKEAYILGKKCITLRSETEWVETLANGWNTLVFDDLTQIAPAINKEPGIYENQLFGNGFAAEEIVALINNYFLNSK